MTERVTLGRYLLIKTMTETHCDVFTALEAVSSTAIEMPGWDLKEERTWEEWRKWNGDA